MRKARRSWEVLGTQSKTEILLEKLLVIKGPVLFKQAMKLCEELMFPW